MNTTPSPSSPGSMLVIFDMLMSLFERAYLVAYTQFQSYLRRIAEEERSALIPLSS